MEELKRDVHLQYGSVTRTSKTGLYTSGGRRNICRSRLRRPACSWARHWASARLEGTEGNGTISVPVLPLGTNVGGITSGAYPTGAELRTLRLPANGRPVSPKERCAFQYGSVTRTNETGLYTSSVPKTRSSESHGALLFQLCKLWKALPVWFSRMLDSI